MPRTQTRRERGVRIDAAIKKAGFSQTFIAEQMGCSRQLVGTWIAGGNISGDQLAQLCLLVKCTIDEIAYGTASTALHPDEVEQQFARLDPWLRERLWPLYQVFVRPGAADRVEERC